MAIPILSRGDVKRGLFQRINDRIAPDGAFNVSGVPGVFDFGQGVVTSQLRLWAEWTERAYTHAYMPSASPQQYVGAFQIDVHEQELDNNGKTLYLADNAGALFMDKLYNDNDPLLLNDYGLWITEPQSVNVDTRSNHAQVALQFNFYAWRM